MSDPSRARAHSDGDPEVVREFARAAAGWICRVATDSLERTREA